MQCVRLRVGTTRSSTPTPRSAAVSRSSTTAIQWLDLTVLGRQEEWEEPAGRAAPLGLQVGGPAMRLPDEYDV